MTVVPILIEMSAGPLAPVLPACPTACAASSASRARRASGLRRRSLMVAVCSALAVIAMLIAPSRVAAHTDFVSSTPSADETVDRPVDGITLRFSGSMTPIEDAMVVLDPSGQTRSPDQIVQPDAATLVLRFEPPLAGGEVGVRWGISSGDGHR
ncbi:MAG: copper resistance CopC family protein, partial [Actinomycetota bacterium]